MRGLLLCFLLWVPGAVVVGQLSESLKLSESSASKPGYKWKRAITPAALSLAAGATWGTHETLTHKNSLFFKTFPGASRRFWGADSWKNKYTGGDPTKGRNGVPVWFTDGKHLTASVHHTLIFAAGVTVTIGAKRPTWHYLADAGISFVAYSLGNWLAREVVFDW